MLQSMGSQGVGHDWATKQLLLYNVVLVSTVQQNESAICIHLSLLFWISFPFRSPLRTD